MFSLITKYLLLYFISPSLDMSYIVYFIIRHTIYCVLGGSLQTTAGKRRKLRQTEPRIDLTRKEKRGYLTGVVHHKGCSQAAAGGSRLPGRRAVLESVKARPEPGLDLREVMNIRQASGYLGISPDTLYKYLSEGRLPAFKLGNRWRFKKTTLDRWMELQSEHGTGKGRSGPASARRATG